MNSPFASETTPRQVAPRHPHWRLFLAEGKDLAKLLAGLVAKGKTPDEVLSPYDKYFVETKGKTTPMGWQRWVEMHRNLLTNTNPPARVVVRRLRPDIRLQFTLHLFS